METIKVWPVEGRSMPREDNPQRRITEPVAVPNTVYYRRAIARGDLHDEAAHRALERPALRPAMGAKSDPTKES